MDIVSDSLSKIKNAILSRKRGVILRDTKSVKRVLDVLLSEGFIEGYEPVEEGLDVHFAFDGRRPLITDIKRVSKPGSRIYVRANDIKPVYSGRGVGIISTSSGVVSDDVAREKNLGGEYICQVW